jgi:predicted nucleic acid-binding protein
MTSKLILLDSGPLGIISNPSESQTVVTCREWVRRQHEQGHVIVVPEIADYEVRRELLRADKLSGLQRLDFVKATFAYQPITTAVMLRAAQLWAQARKTGRPTADNAALDADVILAAQAAILIDEGGDALIATSNPRHLSLFVPAAEWQSIN